ncbi:hypothetical protein [Salinirubrum litoreum]|uniref:Lipoprotein n=1 Tax=Salinirubrum litoreum TaxID=1126234 RepID=A0ABD5RC22_9EURY|nr:hypothetical protein [Salinirubrum litoreum]
MQSWSRRHALQALSTGALAALAGCSGSSSGGSSNNRVPRGTPVKEYDERRVRRDADRPLVTVTAESDDTLQNDNGVHEYLTSPDEVEGLSFDLPDGAGDFRTFVTDTDFESALVLLVERTVAACSDLEVVGVYREDDGLDVQFCSAEKPADAACASGDRDRVAVAIRLPFTGERLTGFGYGWSSSCHTRPRPFDPPEDDEGGEQR